jgi:hypothetical protein
MWFDCGHVTCRTGEYDLFAIVVYLDRRHLTDEFAA